MLIFIIVLYLLSLPSCYQIKCSPQCLSVCTSHQLSCVVCLAKYYQTIQSSNLKCSCMDGFKPFQNFNTTYCCPNGCRSCDRSGCSQCWTFGSITYDLTLKANKCVCKQNFFMNDDGICECFSTVFPRLYYWSSLFEQCLLCPKGCTCNQNGCYNCQNSTRRNIITQKQSNTSICHCINGFNEWKGQCICPRDCNCTQIRNSVCAPESHRYNNTGNWKCIYPYVQTGQACVCSPPYEQIARPDGKLNCQCKSFSSPTLYFKHLEVCSVCFVGCFCDERGCHYCQSSSAISLNYNCFCSNNFTFTKNGCECIFPSYYFSLSNKTCNCLSDLNSSKYYFSKSDQKCRVCPQGCKCNQNGCIQCAEDNLRVINKISQTEYICICAENSYQTLEGTCRCKMFHKKHNNDSRCVCDGTLAPLVFADFDLETCILCPVGCQCNQSGCFRCSQLTYRKISKNSDGIYTCYCSDNFIETSTSVFCVCNYNYTFIAETKACQCVEPSYINEFQRCVCSSELNNTHYYYDSPSKKCQVCPYNCMCNQFGCIECHDQAMRISVFDLQSLTYVCRCLQNAFFIDNYCTICPNTSYYYGGICVDCIDCQRCDSRGCLSCNTTIMYLNDFKCECLESMRLNKGGKCLCQDGYHNDTLYNTGQCVRCPLWCAVCTDNQVIQCLLCPVGVYRTNSPSRNCQCIDGYIQAYPMQEYCCHQSCDSCNQTQCITCPQFSYRQVDNNICGCVYPFIQINNGACICDDSFYLLNGQCFKCPQSCKTCYYTPNMSYIQCTSCSSGMNRNMSDINCTCLPGYYQSKPIQSQFCILNNCLQQVANCTSCLNQRVVTDKGCVCPPGKFQNYFSFCQACNITGCLQCQQYLLCYNCDIANSYYLSNLRCYYYNNNSIFLFGYVGTNQLVIQSKLQFDIQQYVGVGVSLIRVENPDQIKTYEPIVVEMDYFNLNQNKIMTCIFNSTEQTYTDILISLNISYVTNTSKTLRFYQQNMYQSIVFGFSVMNNFMQSSGSKALFAGSIIFTICSYVLYVIGFKHNNLLFYIQTLSFMAFVIDESVIVNVVFLYNLRYSYFDYDVNPLWNLIPVDYFEKCPGNYYITSIDCNIIRNIGVALLIALIAGGLITIFRFVHFFLTAHLSLNTRILYYKKFFYRTLEFFHKTTMFPLIYFSIQTLLNTTGYVLIDSTFKQKCIILSSIILMLYVIHQFIEVYFNLASKMYRIQNFMELVCTLSTSFILILSRGSAWLVLIMVVIIVKNGIYCIVRTKYMNQHKSYLLILPSFLSAISVLLVVLKVNRIAVVVVFLFNCILHIVINSILTHWFFLMGKFDKIQQRIKPDDLPSMPSVPTQTDLISATQTDN